MKRRDFVRNIGLAAVGATRTPQSNSGRTSVAEFAEGIVKCQVCAGSLVK